MVKLCYGFERKRSKFSFNFEIAFKDNFINFERMWKGLQFEIHAVLWARQEISFGMMQWSRNCTSLIYFKYVKVLKGDIFIASHLSLGQTVKPDIIKAFQDHYNLHEIENISYQDHYNLKLI